jgi:hypothetical protein
MMLRLSAAAALTLLLAACQSTNPADYRADEPCLQRKVGSKLLAKVAGVGLGLAGVPGGGLVGRGVGLATDPRCQALRLRPDAEERLRRERRLTPEQPRETIFNPPGVGG